MESLKAGLSKATNVVSNAAEEAQEKARAISVDAKEKVADVKEKVADVKEKVKDAKDAAVEKLKDASLGLAKRVATAALRQSFILFVGRPHDCCSAFSIFRVYNPWFT